MPTYPYECESCQIQFDISKRVSQIDEPEFCAKCDSLASRYISRTHFYGAGDWNAEVYRSFNPGLGEVVRSKRHQKEILRKMNGEGRAVEEIGNEPVEKIHKHFDDRREETRKNRWRDDRAMLHE